MSKHLTDDLLGMIISLLESDDVAARLQIGVALQVVIPHLSLTSALKRLIPAML